MAMLSAAQLFALWEPASGAPAHQRLEPLVAALNPGEAIAQDTLGARNRRLLALQAALGEPPPGAHLRCRQCGTDNEFAVPAADILACPVPAASARVVIRSGSRRLTFRLPRMADLSEAASSEPGDALGLIVARCRIGGAPDDPIPPAAVARLAARFEALDPAARILIDLACAECGAALRATVDLAEFAAAAVERLIDRLQREIHVIAGAYGWTESEILALPQSRRRRYVAMIAAQPAAAEPAPRVRQA
jgi:hypothetical protein